MLIGKLSTLSGYSKDTIRYYEKIGLIQSACYDRQLNNYKNYSTQTLTRLSHVTELKAAGFSLTEITEMLATFQGSDQPCARMPEKLAEKLAKINEKIKSLEQHKRAVQNYIDACDSRCVVKDGMPHCMACT